MLQVSIDAAGYKQNSPSLQGIVQRAEEIYRQAILKKPQIRPDHYSYRFLSAMSEKCRDQLREAYPQLQWKFSLKDGMKVFAISTREQTEVVQKELSKNGIQAEVKQVRGKEDFCIVLDAPNPEELERFLETRI